MFDVIPRWCGGGRVAVPRVDLSGVMLQSTRLDSTRPGNSSACRTDGSGHYSLRVWGCVLGGMLKATLATAGATYRCFEIRLSTKALKATPSRVSAHLIRCASTKARPGRIGVDVCPSPSLQP